MIDMQVVMCAFIFGFVIGTIVTYRSCISNKMSELWFFPDKRMPCCSYYGYSSPNTTRITRCTRILSCPHYHTEDYGKSSLMKLKKRGTKIRIITDNPNETIEGDQIPRMKQYGIQVKKDNQYGVDDKRPLMHNKFVIVDNTCCLLGSFNWTHAGVTKNQESVLKIYEPGIVQQLIVKFDQMWNELE